MTTTRTTRHGRDIVECQTCRDCTEVSSDTEAAAFGERHHHINSKLPPSMERAARSRAR